jgi:acetate kinase
MNVLAIDGGSSSLKVAAYEMPSERHAGEANVPIADQERALNAFIDKLQQGGASIDAVGHRIVFGGADHTQPERVTPELLAEIERLVPFVPLHLRAELDAVALVQKRLPGVPHVLCFDTAFHQRMPSIAKRYPLGEEFEGARRFGFHGLSLEYIVSVIGKSGRTIVAHLGNGASISAIRDGEPVDTTMGISPLGGIMMGTRPGDLDPGVLFYAQSELGITNEKLRSLITNSSGLLGVSGISSDMRVLEERSKDDPKAALAIELFIYIARKHIGALTATLGGVDLLVFTAGIGENSARVRDGICEGLDYLRPFDVRVIPTNESLVIARHVCEVENSFVIGDAV